MAQDEKKALHMRIKGVGGAMIIAQSLVIQRYYSGKVNVAKDKQGLY